MMILYFIKTILLLGLFYFLYSVLMKNKKSFRWNRFYLVMTAILSVILPFLNGVRFKTGQQVVQNSKSLAITLDTIEVYATSVNAVEIDYSKIIFGIYMIGLLWGLLRIALGYFVIRRIKQGATIEDCDGKTVFFHPQIESPFSFGRDIFIPDVFKGKPVLVSILHHESVHVDRMHSRDKLLIAVLQSLYWYNPFVYLYHKELELIHEFEADEISAGQISTDDYVENILQAVRYYQTPTLLVNHFFHHPLKTIITMLYKQPNRAVLQKYLLAFFTSIVCLLTLYLQGRAQHKKSRPLYTIDNRVSDTIAVEDPVTGKVDLVIAKREPDTLYESADIMPEFNGGDDRLIQYLSKEMRYPSDEARKNISGKVIVGFTVNKDGMVKNVEVIKYPPNGENLAKQAKRVVEVMPKWKPGTLEGRPVSVKYTLPVDFRR